MKDTANSEKGADGTDHGDSAIYCEVAERYLLGRDENGCCRFCGEELTGERYERMVERVEEHGGDI